MAMTLSSSVIRQWWSEDGIVEMASGMGARTGSEGVCETPLVLGLEVAISAVAMGGMVKLAVVGDPDKQLTDSGRGCIFVRVQEYGVLSEQQQTRREEGDILMETRSPTVRGTLTCHCHSSVKNPATYKR
jgi:hypothetical protein